MAKIEMELSEYQGMKTKIKNLESALNSVSKEAAVNKEVIEQAKTLVEDLQDEGIIDRIFSWKQITSPLKELLEKKNVGGNIN